MQRALRLIEAGCITLKVPGMLSIGSGFDIRCSKQIILKITQQNITWN